MNPAMLEASDDLTNLSHLNEPAGRDTMVNLLGDCADRIFSLASHQVAICTKGNIHI